ncbi:bla regulator protein blaR1 [Paenibacillus sp. 1_12]|uniref:M56 family metallopeptidase n=1 Tax=Paenibacillus sp. 1_12 TaxID=1566278 RepID=UPI0008DED2FF|nr:M56 family metallopeptidase [Paenibacillus sp. 1_12]SFL00644.1 bla regulator protein blaR1 [Paenibacillus sp. 1_12]
MKLLETMFSLLLTASLASTVILLLVLLIRKLFNKHLSPRVVHILWFLVLIKLLVPIAPQSAISLFNLLPQAMQVEWNSNQKNMSPNYSSDSDSSTIRPLKNNEENILLSESIPNRTEQTASAIVSPSPQNQGYEKNQHGLTWLTIALLIWFGGVLFLGGYYLFSALIFRTRVGESRKLDNQEILTVLEACKKKLNIRRQIHTYETNHLRSPCLYGLWKPRIYLPEDIVTIADSSQLTHILMHELTHFKRKDLWCNFLWMLSVAMHWYNPLVWLAARKMKADQEVACDASVLEVLGEREASSYGMTLLMLSRLFSRGTSSRVNLSYFGDNKNETKRRIMMITKFKKGSYKLSAAAILFVLALSVILLTNASDSESDVTTPAANSKGALPSIYNDSFIWFNSLDRALDFPKYTFKVVDYLPEGYQMRDVLYSKSFTRSNDADLIDVTSITFVSNFGNRNENTITVSTAIGNGNLLEHNQLLGAHYPQGTNETPEYQQEFVTIGNVKGTLFTDTRRYKQRPETGKSFYWQDDSVWYAIDYYSEYMSQEELAKMVESFVLPQQVQHVRYDGAGNSFPLYDETDLIAAKNILGFKVKIPLNLNDTEVALRDLTMLRGNDQNTGYSFRQTEDALWSTYNAPVDSNNRHDLLMLYQSKAPLFDAAKLSFSRKIEINGVEMSAYADKDHVYFEPSHDGNGRKLLSLTYYLWKQDGIYYIAVFNGMDKYQEEYLKALVMAPLQ